MNRPEAEARINKYSRKLVEAGFPQEFAGMVMEEYGGQLGVLTFAYIQINDMEQMMDEMIKDPNNTSEIILEHQRKVEAKIALSKLYSQ